MNKNEGKAWVRDLAQEQTINRWKKDGAVVKVRTLGGTVTGKILHIGPYSIKVRSHEVGQEAQDVCIFKTGVTYIIGPMVDPVVESVTEIGSKQPKPEPADHCSDVEVAAAG